MENTKDYDYMMSLLENYTVKQLSGMIETSKSEIYRIKKTGDVGPIVSQRLQKFQKNTYESVVEHADIEKIEEEIIHDIIEEGTGDTTYKAHILGLIKKSAWYIGLSISATITILYWITEIR